MRTRRGLVAVFATIGVIVLAVTGLLGAPQANAATTTVAATAVSVSSSGTTVTMTIAVAGDPLTASPNATVDRIVWIVQTSGYMPLCESAEPGFAATTSTYTKQVTLTCPNPLLAGTYELWLRESQAGGYSEKLAVGTVTISAPVTTTTTTTPPVTTTTTTTSTATVTIPVTETTTATSTTTKTKTTPAAVPAKRGDGPPFPWLPVGAGLFLFATAVLTRRRSA